MGPEVPGIPGPTGEGVGGPAGKSLSGPGPWAGAPRMAGRRSRAAARGCGWNSPNSVDETVK